MGQSGAIAMLILLFLAVTSACSAEQIAVSSVLTYDVYAVYINPNATEKQILWSSHVCILAYSIFMGGIATAFLYIGVSMGYL
jgi:urea-proton symporter